mmetsp:Transcript_829/g.1613  ORF Transcript_829/g.1613 Transcript_829/m.1613 type:complete len:233 (+) Transcript_829:944-1642(+)
MAGNLDGVVHVVFDSVNRIAFDQPSAHQRQAVFVHKPFGLCCSFVVSCWFCWLTTFGCGRGRVSKRVVDRFSSEPEVVQVGYFVLVDAAVAEPSVCGAFADDHRVFHIVACVGDDRYHSVAAQRVLVHVVLLVRVVAHHRPLRSLNSVDLVVNPVRVGVVRGPHRLLTHLALVHVPRRLVEIGEWGHGGDDGQHGGGGDLFVGGLALSEIVVCARDLHIHLLLSPDPLDKWR